MFTIVFFDEKIKKIVAKANVMIAFFIHLHIVIMRDVKKCEKDYQ